MWNSVPKTISLGFLFDNRYAAITLLVAGTSNDRDIQPIRNPVTEADLRSFNFLQTNYIRVCLLQPVNKSFLIAARIPLTL
jgi:hypothetical protein